MFCSSIHDNKLSPLCGKAGLPPRAARFSQFLTRPALFAAAALSIGLASGGKIPGLHEACSAEYTWGSTSGNAWTWGPGSSAGWASGTPADAWDAGQANTAIFNWSGNHNTTITLTGDIHLATLWLKGNNGGNPISFTGGSLQFGANQGLIDATGITVNGGWYYIGTPLVGTGGLVLRSHVLANDGSTGLLRLNGNNFGLTGGITIEKGYVVPDTPAAFGGNVITLDGGGIGIYTAFYGYNNPILNDIVIGPNGGSFRTWNSNECYGIFNGTISGTGALTIGAGKVAGDIRFSGDWQHTGNINLVAGHISFAPAAGEVMEINNKISGNGGVRIAGQGVVRLTNMNSTFLGAEPNTDNRSSVYIYSGATLEVEDFGNTTSGPLGPNLNRGTVNNRDAHRNLIAMENGATLRYTGTGAGVLDRNIRRMPGGDVVAIIDVVEPTATLLLSYVSGFYHDKKGLGTLVMGNPGSAVVTDGSGNLAGGTIKNGTSSGQYWGGFNVWEGTLILARSTNAAGENNKAYMRVYPGATLRLGSAAEGNTTGNQIYQDVEMHGGTFDMNGMSETIGGLNSIGDAPETALVTNTAGTLSVLTIGESNRGSLFNGTISNGVGGIDIVKTGTGTFTMGPTSEIAPGATIPINDGILVLAGTAPVPRSFTVASDGDRLKIGSAGATAGGLAPGCNVALNHTNSYLETYQVNDLTFDGVISGVGGFAINSLAKITLTNTNTYTGRTYLQSMGILSINSKDKINGTNGVALKGGYLEYTGTGEIAFPNGQIYYNEGPTGNTISGGFIVTDPNATIRIGNTNGSSNATRAVEKRGPGTLVIGGDRDNAYFHLRVYEGNVLLEKESSVAYHSANALEIYAGGVKITGTGVSQINILTMFGGTLDLNGTTQTNSSNTGTATNQGVVFGNSTGGSKGVIFNSNVSVATLYLRTGDTTSIYTYDGVFREDTGKINIIWNQGNLVLTGENTNTGTLQLNNTSSWTIGSGGDTGTLDAVSIHLNSANASLVFNRSDNSLVIPGVITGSGKVAQNGEGMTTLFNASTYTGGTTVNAGTLHLDFSHTGAVANNILPSGSAIAINNGGTLRVTAPAAGNAAQNIGTVTVVNGGVIEIAPSTGSRLDLIIASVNVTGAGMLNLLGSTTTAAGSSVTPSTANFILTAGTTGNNGSTRIPGVLINGTQWATTIQDGGQNYVVPWVGSSLQDVDAQGNGGMGSTLPDSITAAIRLVDNADSGASDPVQLAATTTKIESLLATNNRPSVIDTAGKKLVLATGDLAQTGSAPLTIGQNAGDGQFSAGTTDNTVAMLRLSNTSAANLTVNAAITNNGTGPVSLAISGTGTVVLAATNTYIGATTIDTGATLKLTGKLGGTGSIASSGTLHFASGITQQFTGTSINLAGDLILDNNNLTIYSSGTGFIRRISSAISGDGILNITHNATSATTNSRIYISGDQSNTNGGLIFNFTGGQNNAGKSDGLNVYFGKTNGAKAVPAGGKLLLQSAASTQLNVIFLEDNQFGEDVVLDYGSSPNNGFIWSTMNGTSQTVGGLKSGSSRNSNGGGVLDGYTNSFAHEGRITVPNPGSTLTINTASGTEYLFSGHLRDEYFGATGVIGTKINIIKKGEGTQILAGNIGLNGRIEVQKGELELSDPGNNANYGMGGELIVQDGGAMRFNNIGYSVNKLPATATIEAGGTLIFSGTINASFLGTLILDGGTTEIVPTADGSINGFNMGGTLTGTGTYISNPQGSATWSKLTGTVSLDSNSLIQVVNKIFFVQNPAGTLDFAQNQATLQLQQGTIFDLYTGYTYAGGGLEGSGIIYASNARVAGQTFTVGQGGSLGDTHTFSGLISSGGKATSGGVNANNNRPIYAPIHFIKTGAGTQVLSGYVEAPLVTINGGALQYGDGTANAVSTTAKIVNNAQLAINVTSGTSTVFGTAVSGAGSFVKDGGGTLTLNNKGAWAGTTLIKEGILKIGGSSLKSGSLVMPFGDSITLGSGTDLYSGYRGFLSDIFSANGTFNGSRFAGEILDSALPGAYSAHAGISGDRIQFQIGLGDTDRSGLLSGRINMKPDAMLVHLGVNDINGGINQAQMEANMKEMLRRIVTGTPDTTIFLATIVPAYYNGYAPSTTVNATREASINAFNAWLRAFAANPASYDTVFTGARIVLVDLSDQGGFPRFLYNGGSAMSQDGLHPDNNGYSWMAMQFYNALLENLGQADSEAIPRGTAVEINASGTLDLDRHNITIGALTGNGTVALGTGMLTLALSTGTADFGGVISGTGKLIKADAGTQKLSGVSTYTGNTTVGGGVLEVTGSLGSGSYAGAIELVGGALVMNQTTAQTLSGVISGTGALTKTGTGALTLSGANTYTGGTEVTGGRVNFNNGNNFGGGGANVLLNGGGLQWATGTSVDISARLAALGSGGGTLDTNGNDVTLATGISGTGALTKAGAGKLTLSGVNAYAGATAVSGGVLEVTGSLGGGSYAGDIGLVGGSLVMNQAAAQTLSGVISGAGVLTKAGAGALTLSGANIYSGATTVSGGTLEVTGSLGGGSYAGDIELVGGVLSMNQAAVQTLSGVISGVGVLTKAGAGKLTLSGANTHTGATTVSSGVLEVTGSLGGGNYVGGIELVDGSLVMDQTAAQTLSGALSGVGGDLVKRGANTLTLSSAVSGYGGRTIVEAGVLRVSSEGAIGTAGLELGGVGTVGTFHPQGSAGVWALSRSVHVNGGGGVLDVDAGMTLKPGALSSGATAVLEKLGGGKVQLETASAGFAGTLCVSGGDVTLAVADAVPNAVLVKLDGGSLTATQAQSISRLEVESGSVFTMSGAGVPDVRDLTLGDAHIKGSLANANTVTIAAGGSLELAAGVSIGVGGDFVLGDGSEFVANSADALVAVGTIVIGGSAAAQSIISVNSYTGTGELVLARAWDIVAPDGYKAFVDGTAAPTSPTPDMADQFMALDVVIEPAGSAQKQLVAKSQLVWNVATPGQQHGTFNVNTIFTIDATFGTPPILKDNFNAVGGAGYGGWDGTVLTKQGLGELILVTANTYTGATNIEEGRLTIHVPGAVGTGASPVNISEDGFFNLAFTDANPASFGKRISGAGAVEKRGAGKVTFTEANDYTGPTSIIAGTLALGASGSIAGSSLVTLNPGTVFDISGIGGATFVKDLSGAAGTGVVLGAKTLQLGAGNFGGTITGSGKLEKTGAGVLVLSGANTFAGGLRFEGSGDVELVGDAAAGTGQITHNGTGTLVLADGLSLANAILFFSGGNRKISVAGSGTVVLNGTLSGSGRLEKTGDGVLALTGDNSVFPGGLEITAGALEFASTHALGSGGVVIGAAGVVRSGAGNANLLNEFSGDGRLVVSTGALVLKGANTAFSGVAEILPGARLSIADGTNLGTASLELGGSLVVTGSTPFVLGAPALALAAGGGEINVQNATQRLELGATLSGGPLTKSGAGALVLTSANSAYAGGVTVTGGTLALQDGEAAGPGDIILNAAGVLHADFSGVLSNNLGGEGRLRVDNACGVTLDGTNIGFGGTLAVGGGAQVSVGHARNIGLAQLELGDAVSSGLLVTTGMMNIQLPNSPVRIGAGGGALNVANGAQMLELGGVVTGDGALAKQGSGALALSGANTFTGGLLFESGTLELLSAAAAGTGVLVHSSSGHLRLADGIAVANTIALAPGAMRKISVAGQATLTGALTGGAAGFSKEGAGRLELSRADALDAFEGAVTIAAGTLGIRTPRLETEVHGTGTLAVTLGAAGDAFSVGPGARNSTFGGTLALERGTLSLNDAGNSAMLAAARLSLGAGGTATLGANAAINTLVFDGGTLRISMGVYAPEGVLTVNLLDIKGAGGGISADFSTGLVATLPDPGAQLFDMWAGGGNYQRQVISASSVNNSGTIAWRDAAGADVVDGEYRRELSDAQGGRVGELVFNYAGTVRTTGNPGEKGLWLGYGLVAVNADAGKTLQLDASASVDARLYASLGGAGSFHFTGQDAQSIIIGNAASSYTGDTTLDGIRVVLEADNAFGATARLALVNAAQLDMGGHATAIGTLDATDPAVRIRPGVLTVGQGEFAGELSGDGTLAKAGSGALTLSGRNTHTGTLAVADGLLRVTGTLGESPAGADFQGGITLGAGAVIEFSQDGVQKLSGLLSGDGTLAKTGSGTLVISGAASHGATSVTGGALQINNDGNLGRGVNTLDNATLILAGHGGSVYSAPWTLASGGGTISTTLDATLAGELDGPGVLHKAGPGTLTLATASHHTGLTRVEAGTLELAVPGALATGAGLEISSLAAVRASGAQTLARLDLPTGATYTAIGAERNLTLGAGVIQGTLNSVHNLVKEGAGRLELNGTAAEPLVLDGLLVVNQGTLGLGADAGGPTLVATSLAFHGTSVIDITGYTGASLGSAGHVFIETTEIIPEGALPWRYTIAGTTNASFATLQLGRGPDGRNLVGRVDLAWNDMQTGPGNEYSIAHGTFHIEQGNSFRLDAALADRAPGLAFATGWDGRTLTKTGGGHLVLAGGNTYTGNTLVREGTVEVTGSLGAAPGDPTQGYRGSIEIGPEASLVLNQGLTQVIRGSITGEGTLDKRGPGLLIVNGPLALHRLELGTSSVAELQGSTLVTTAHISGRTLFGGAQATIATLEVSPGGEAIFNTEATLGTARIDGALSFNAHARVQGPLSTTPDARLNLDTGVVLTLEADATLEADLAGAQGTLHNTTGHLEAWSLSGTLHNDATASLSGNIGGTLRNTGHAQVKGSVSGPVENAAGATLSIDGALGSTLDNAGHASLASSINGDVHNHAGATLSLMPAITHLDASGRLYNSGLVHFGNLGQTFRVNALHNETPGQPGRYSLEIDIIGRSDHIEIAPGGTISGAHTFEVRTVVNPLKTTASTRIKLIEGGIIEPGTSYSLAHPVDSGLYRLVLASPQEATLIPKGYASSPQAAVNATGAIATGWFAQLDNLAHRLGELHTPGNEPHQDNDLWIRAYAQENNTRLGLEGIAEARQHQYGADIGYDHDFHPTPEQRLHLGAFAGYQATRQQYHDGLGGKGNASSTHLGLYATWAHADGWYIDTVFKAQINEHDYDAGGDHGEWDTTQFGFSLEIGKRWQSQGGWFLEPSLHAAWSLHLAEGYDTAAGLHTRVANSDISRLGASLRLGKRIPLPTGHLQPYAKAGLETIHSQGGQVRITLDETTERLTPNLDGTRFHAGLGLGWQITPTHQVHLDYEGAWGGKYNTPWNITAGYKMKF